MAPLTFFITFISSFMLHNMRVSEVGDHLFRHFEKNNKTSCFNLDISSVSIEGFHLTSRTAQHISVSQISNLEF